MAVSEQQQAKPVLAAASSPVAAALAVGAVVPSTPATQSQQPIAIMIQMPPAADPHWTAYWTALGTPIVAFAAAAVAGLIAYRNWRTAQNKLKLDLYERRKRVLTDIREIIQTTTEYQMITDSTVTDFEQAINEAEWLFGEDVYSHLSTTTLEVFKKYVVAILNSRNAKYALRHKGDPDGDKEIVAEAHAAESNAYKELMADSHAVVDLLAPYLRLSH